MAAPEQGPANTAVLARPACTPQSPGQRQAAQPTSCQTRPACGRCGGCHARPKDSLPRQASARAPAFKTAASNFEAHLEQGPAKTAFFAPSFSPDLSRNPPHPRSIPAPPQHPGTQPATWADTGPIGTRVFLVQPKTQAAQPGTQAHSTLIANFEQGCAKTAVFIRHLLRRPPSAAPSPKRLPHSTPKRRRPPNAGPQSRSGNIKKRERTLNRNLQRRPFLLTSLGTRCPRHCPAARRTPYTACGHRMHSRCCTSAACRPHSRLHARCTPHTARGARHLATVSPCKAKPMHLKFPACECERSKAYSGPSAAMARLAHPLRQRLRGR